MQNSPESEARQQPSPEAQPEPDEVTSELAELEDRYKRALADLDNYRKRTAREIERRVAEAREALLLDWLDVVDSVERAMRTRVRRARASTGCARCSTRWRRCSPGRARTASARPETDFDPERHEAIAVQPSADVPDRTILAVERSGFALGDRVIRPAQVVVARTPEHVR